MWNCAVRKRTTDQRIGGVRGYRSPNWEKNVQTLLDEGGQEKRMRSTKHPPIKRER